MENPYTWSGPQISNPTTPSSDAVQMFGTASQDYGKAQQEAQIASQNLLAESFRNYAVAIQSVQESLIKRQEEAYTNYAGQLQAATQGPDPQAVLEQAYRDHVTALHGAAEEARSQYEQAYNNYVSALQAGQSEAQKRLKDAYREYLRSLQQAWSQLDIDGLVDSTFKG